jgi:hypothetical protein
VVLTAAHCIAETGISDPWVEVSSAMGWRAAARARSHQPQQHQVLRDQAKAVALQQQ